MKLHTFGAAQTAAGLPRPVGHLPTKGTLPDPNGKLAPVPWSQCKSEWGKIDYVRMGAAEAFGLCLVCGLEVAKGIVLADCTTNNPAEHAAVYRLGDLDRREVFDHGPLHDRCAKLTLAHCPHLRGKPDEYRIRKYTR